MAKASHESAPKSAKTWSWGTVPSMRQLDFIVDISPANSRAKLNEAVDFLLINRNLL